jgi:misacylated tRNA(Ala) deacylase
MHSYQLYHRDSYVREMEAVVVHIEGNRIALDQTIFYAQSGGQPADHGTLWWTGGQARIVDVRRQGEIHWHQGNPRLWPARLGTPLCLNARAYRSPYSVRCHLARLRSTRHKQFDGARQRASGFRARAVDYGLCDRGRTTRQCRDRGEAFSIPDLIRTKVNLLPEGIEVVRVCEIVGLDLQADGGTHVAQTGEVGPIRVRGHESKGRFNKRVRLDIAG